jgi:uncharacterized protein YecE (DUF72 family)
MSKIHIGTSGFSYDDWMGPFYPPSIKPNHRLEYYAQKFNTVELNSSFYQLPALPAVYGMLNKVPEDFDFFVKAHRDLTHVRKNARETLPRFREMLRAYQRENKLAGVLFQFPANFERTGSNEDHLRWLVDSLDGVRTVMEFRHSKWINEHAMEVLRELKAGYCIVDMPQVRDLPSSRLHVTADLAYVRFHGQNREQWARASTRNERYDYDYSDEQLQEWVPVIANLGTVKDTYVYFNNHYQGKAAKNAKTLEGFLESFVRGSDVQRLPIG